MDCDDGDADINPDADEIWGNDVDENCDLATRPPQEGSVGCGDVFDAWVFPSEAGQALEFRVDTDDAERAFDPWAVLLPGVSGALDPVRPDALASGNDEVPCSEPPNTFGCPQLAAQGVEGGVTLLVGSMPGTCLGDETHYTVAASIADEQVDGDEIVGDAEPGFDPDLDNDGSYFDEDCNDNNAQIYPGNWEDPGDGVDSDCDGTDATGLIFADRYLAGVGGDYAGDSLDASGDFDGDGIPDLLVGAHGDSEGGNEAGKVYLVYGASLRRSAPLDLPDAEVSWIGEAEASNTGRHVRAGDIDGDGLDDVVIGAPGYDGLGEDAGRVYVVTGQSLEAGPPPPKRFERLCAPARWRPGGGGRGWRQKRAGSGGWTWDISLVREASVPRPHSGFRSRDPLWLGYDWPGVSRLRAAQGGDAARTHSSHESP